MAEMITIKMYVNTGFANATHEDSFQMEHSEWDAMSESEQGAFLDQAAQDYMSNYIECGAYVEEEE